jgi:CP family cyanate transporter-like MFS transporter
VLALAAAVPWVVAAREGRGARVDLRPAATIGIATLARSRRAWVMAAFFGVQSAQAYAQFGWFAQILDDAGLSTASAGAMLGLLAAVGVPITLALPRLVAWTGDGPLLPWIFSALVVGGWLGVLLAPTAAPWLWAAMLGAGGVAFPWFLTQITRRAGSVDGTAALSGFAQSAGYLIAIVGPLGVGILHEATGSWDVAVVVLAVEALLIGILGTWVVRPGTIEDDLARS